MPSGRTRTATLAEKRSGVFDRFLAACRAKGKEVRRSEALNSIFDAATTTLGVVSSADEETACSSKGHQGNGALGVPCGRDRRPHSNSPLLPVVVRDACGDSDGHILQDLADEQTPQALLTIHTPSHKGHHPDGVPSASLMGRPANDSAVDAADASGHGMHQQMSKESGRPAGILLDAQGEEQRQSGAKQCG
jgi:hypothetical protein